MLEEFQKIPKVELHLHLDGSISKEIASSLSGLFVDEVASKMIAPDQCENLSSYLTKFDFSIDLMQTKENLYLVAKDLVDQLEKENVVYAEIRFAPMFHTKRGLSYEEVVEAVLEGLRSNLNVRTNLILCMMRGFSEKENLKTIEVAKKYLDQGVCAIDLAGAEDQFCLDEYLSLFQIVKKQGIPYTIHAGENGSADEVRKAIEIGAYRIGHGIHSIEDEQVLKLIRQKNILLEVCPTSNVQTNAVSSFFNHPVYKLYQSQIPISINTDNRTVSNTTLSDEYFKLYQTFSFQIEDFVNMNKTAINHAFLTEKEKQELLFDLDKRMQQLNLL